MNKKSQRFERTQLNDTLKKSPIKDALDISSNKEQNFSIDEDQKRSAHKMLEFEEYPIYPHTSKLKQRRIQTDFDRYDMFKSSQKMNKNAQNNLQMNHKKLKNSQQLLFQLQKCQKQILIKDGQIYVLQKIINQHLKDQTNQRSQLSFQISNKFQQQKDVKLNQYLDKINQLSEQIRFKNDELSKCKYENYKLLSIVQNLQNQLYLQKHHYQNIQNIRLIKDLNFCKQLKSQKKLKSKTNSIVENNNRSQNKPQGYSKNIDDLQKRLDILKQNKVEIERSKSKGKSNTARQSVHDVKDNNDRISQSIFDNNKLNLDFRLNFHGYQNRFANRNKNKPIN